MKYLVLVMLFSVNCFAQKVPEYLKDGVITVTLKNGKTHTFSANEYAVVKREEKKLPVENTVVQQTHTTVVFQERKVNKHIISGELLSSRNGGLRDKSTANTVEIETERRVGVGIMYQNNIYDNIYLGGRVDSNGGAGINLGLGF